MRKEIGQVQSDVPCKEQTLQEKVEQLRGIIACGHMSLNQLLNVQSPEEGDYPRIGIRDLVDFSIAEAQSLLDRLEFLARTTGVL